MADENEQWQAVPLATKREAAILVKICSHTG